MIVGAVRRTSYSRFCRKLDLKMKLHILPERHETLAKIKSVLDSNYTLNPGCLINKTDIK